MFNDSLLCKPVVLCLSLPFTLTPPICHDRHALRNKDDSTICAAYIYVHTHMHSYIHTYTYAYEHIIYI